MAWFICSQGETRKLSLSSYSMNSPHPGKLLLHSDGHIHTKYCHHATGEMEEYVLSGISAGLKEIVFLEHMEAGVRYFESTWLSEADFDIYFTEGQRLQEKYKESIRVLLGAEVGYSPTHREELLQRLSVRKWDRIGISYHFMPLPEKEHHLNLVSRKERNILVAESIGCTRVLSDYFTTLTEAVEVLPGTVLCHLDAALRFQPEITINENYRKQIRKLLEAVKRKGMALEVNTSGFTIRGTPFPAPFIIKEALALDIPLCPGSDAHKPEDVGRDFDLLVSYLQNI
jgi:histidinol-phosphatase (PHP family)